MPPRVVEGAGDHRKIPAMESASDSYEQLIAAQHNDEEHQEQLALLEQAQQQALRTAAHAQHENNEGDQRRHHHHPVTPPSHQIPAVASLPTSGSNNTGTPSVESAASFFNSAQPPEHQQQQFYKPPPPPPRAQAQFHHAQPPPPPPQAQHMGLTPPSAVGRDANETLRRRSVQVPVHDSLLRQQHSQSALQVPDEDHSMEASDSSFHLGDLTAPHSFHAKSSKHQSKNNNSKPRAGSSQVQNARLNASLSSLGVTREEVRRQQDYLQVQQIPNRYAAPVRNNSNGSGGGGPPPNRYFLNSGKNIHITPEWSSPTRKRRTAGRQTNHSSLFVSPMSASNGDVLRGIHHQDQLGGSNHDHYSNSYHRSYSNSSNNSRKSWFGRTQTALFSFWTFKMCVLVQIAFVIPLCIFVYDAHHQKRTAHAKLAQFSEEQEHILNQMMWIDKAAKRITDQSKKNSVRGGGSGSHAANLDAMYEAVAAGAIIDGADDLRESMSRLRGQMRDMQYRIQQNSKARITEKYGEDAVRVYINPEPSHPKAKAGGKSVNASDNNGQHDKDDEEEEELSELVLELFVEETPHAVSTWLYQIERGHWNRVQMNYLSQTTILSKPGWVTDPSSIGDFSQTASRLEFLETLPRPAKKNCEVSLVQTGEGGSLALRINLVDGPFHEEDDVCIGRVVNDQLLLPRNREYFMATFATVSSHETKPKSRADEDRGTPHENAEDEEGGGGDIL